MTHYCNFHGLSFDKDANFLLAVTRAKATVSTQWADSLSEACAVGTEVPSSVQRLPDEEAQMRARVDGQGGADSRFWGHSLLEKSFRDHWPKETDYVPSWKDAEVQAAFQKAHQWRENGSNRTQLFSGLFLLHMSDRKDAPVWFRSGSLLRHLALQS